ncbi:hypothetical protein J42TS3_12460 [Paenibacillus vini]|uniref:Lipoprotein n=2 Tax=Paenibacillus vini TaxID=1476024 RepID=A0ABQ4M896_9BACL|nr:hypothetical protein J42TS3_12460 [Paenibacillus vini]
MKKYLFLTLSSLAILSGCGNVASDKINVTKVSDVSIQTEVAKQTTPEKTKLPSEVIALITNGKWEEAKEALENEEYKNAENYNELYSYVDARFDYITEKATGKISYEPILKKLNMINLEAYNGNFKAEITEFKDAFNKERLGHYDKLTEQSKQKGKEEQIRIDEEFEKKIKSGNYDDYSEIAIATIMKIDEDTESRMIYYFAQSQLSLQENDKEMMMYYLVNIPMDYNGRFSDIFMKKKLSIQSKEKWEEAEAYQNELDRAIRIENSKRNPAIGMSADEVRKSKWGSPEDINKTTTKYGVHEQWVYSNYRYIYLEDGVVTAIQD